MPLARINDKLVFFAHIPKTGGSSLENWLSKVGVLAFKHRKPIGAMRCTPQHMHAELFEPLIKGRFVDARFAVLRDPLERMISEYGYRCAQREANGKSAQSFETWARRAMRLARDDAYFLDNHIRPQAEFVSTGMTLFRYEEGLGKVTAWLETLCGVNGPPLEHKLRTDEARPDVSDALRGEIEAFYAADKALIEAQFGPKQIS